MKQLFRDRKEAGLKLAARLQSYKNSKDTLVLGIPRGGVPVAYEIARMLHLPLDVILSKKIGHPANPEFAIGAVTVDMFIVDENSGVNQNYIQSEVKRLRNQINERNKIFRANKPNIEVRDKKIIIADDGIATGNTLLVTIQMLRNAGAGKIIVASPVVPFDRVTLIEKACDEFVYLMVPEYFEGVGGFYENFEQVSDEEVARLLGV